MKKKFVSVAWSIDYNGRLQNFKNQTDQWDSCLIYTELNHIIKENEIIYDSKVRMGEMYIRK